MTSKGSFPFSLRHLVKGSALYGSADVAVAGARFLLIALYTRIMTPAEFGLFSIITTTVTLAVVFIPLGIPSAVMLKMNTADPLGSRACKDGALSFLFQICLVAGVAFYLVSLLAFPGTLIRELSPWLILWALSDVCGMIPKVSLRIKEKIAAFSAAKIVRLMIMVLLLVSLLHSGVKGITAVIVAESLSSIAEWIVCMILDRYVPAQFSFSCLPALLRVGMPLTFVALGMFCIDLSDRYVIFGLLGNQANGFYAAAAKVAVAASFFIEAFNSMWFPYYLRNVREGGGEMDDSLRRYASTLIVLFSVVISLFMLVLPTFVSLHLFGRYFIAQQYRCVTVLVAPLTLAYFFKAAFYVSSTILIAAGKNWKLALTVYVAAGVNIGANLLWATVWAGRDVFYTLTGIALMTSVSYAVCMVLASRAAGLFNVRFWATSRGAWLGATALCLAFLPVPLVARFSAWTFIAGIACWKYLFVKRA